MHQWIGNFGRRQLTLKSIVRLEEHFTYFCKHCWYINQTAATTFRKFCNNAELSEVIQQEVCPAHVRKYHNIVLIVAGGREAL